MISPERLRQNPFFGGLTADQLRSIAMIAIEETHPSGTVLFEKGQPAEALYFLLEGCVDLYFTVSDSPPLDFPDGIPVGEVNPGEPFSISALIEPHILTSTARLSRPSRVIKIETTALFALFKKDKRLAFLLTQQAARAALERLEATRVQLAAAWA
ncbi:MAG: Crp/Fnr family transcriptional regulator [Omnitrophica WOR_2 bacterium]